MLVLRTGSHLTFKMELQKRPIHPGPGEPHADSRPLPSLYFKGSAEPAETLAEADRVADPKAQGLGQRRAEITAPLPCVRWAWTPLSGRARKPRLRARARPLSSGTRETGCSPPRACGHFPRFYHGHGCPLLSIKDYLQSATQRLIAFSEMGGRRHTNKLHMAQTDRGDRLAGLPRKLRTSAGEGPARPGPGEVLPARDDPKTHGAGAWRATRLGAQASRGPAVICQKSCSGLAWGWGLAVWGLRLGSGGL